jgi:hypothetical protein
MIYIANIDLEQTAKSRPIGYLEDCKKAASHCTENGFWAFDKDAFEALVQKYRKYSASASDPYQARISGCCDRADQY